MKLYYTPGACSLSPHISAKEAGIPLELELVDLKTHKTANGDDFYVINPKGYVPALMLDSGELLTEGPAILQYFADLKPAAHLLPAQGDPARYQAISWLAYIGTELHKNFAPLFGKVSDEARQAVTQKIFNRFTFIENKLKSDYLMGNSYTAPDGYLFVMLTWARKMQVDISSLPNLHKFYSRMMERPHVQAALKAEGLT